MGNTSDKLKPTDTYQIKVDEFQQYLQESCNEIPFKKVNKNNYDTILEKLQAFKIISLASTPLGNKLFDFLVQKYNGQITSDNLFRTLTELQQSQDKRCEYTFRAFCVSENKQNNCVDERDFVSLVVDSWDHAFTQLIEKLPQNTKQSDGILIENWSKSQEQRLKVKKIATAEFYNIQKHHQGVSYQQFRAWIMEGKYDKIEAKYENWTVTVPLTLYKFIQ